MVKFTHIITAFINGIAKSKVSLVGATMTTASFPILLIGILLELFGLIHNQYFGFVLYMFVAPAFILGLVLIFLGLFFFKGKEDVGVFTHEYLSEKLSVPENFIKLRKIIFLATSLTFVNVFVIILLAYTGYHYTESNEFCGQLCHSVMEPEYATYSKSPHSRVKCVECHIGTGAQWFVKSKLSGTRQLVAVVAKTYATPIETPVHGLRPARDTCEECHRPELFHGDKLYIKDKFLSDENNTHVQTVLLLKVGSGGYQGTEAHGIHWHVSEENRITYTHSDWEREEINQVTLTKPDGTRVVFDKHGGEVPEGTQVYTREMDCIDCHNRPTHIYKSPEEAIDEKLLLGAIPTELPYIRKIGYEMITREYESHEEAKNQIATELRGWYRLKYPDLVNNNMPMLEQAISGVQAAYLENVWPSMKITWNTYPSLRGHQNDSGCFRCHDDEHETSSGEYISMDCEACHIILAEDEQNPEILKTMQGI
ncbi:MAG: NapC/NirT family cytochrome c [Desulfocapsaceae bacterium]